MTNIWGRKSQFLEQNQGEYMMTDFFESVCTGQRKRGRPRARERINN